MHFKRIQRGPSRAYSHVRGHLRVSRVCLDRPRKKKTARSLSFNAPLLLVTYIYIFFVVVVVVVVVVFFLFCFFFRGGLDHVVGWRLSTDVS